MSKLPVGPSTSATTDLKEPKQVYVPGISRLCKSIRATKAPETVQLEGGALPPWVCGLYLRTGPGLFDLPNHSMQHLFDGFAVLTKFEVESHQVTLTTKYLQSDAYRRALAAGQSVITEFATGPQPDPHQSVFSRIAHTLSPEFTDNNSANIARIGDDFYVLGDTCFFHKIDPITLDTSPEKFDTNKLFSLNVQCSHPVREENGDTWNIGYTVFTGLKFHVFKIPQGQLHRARIVASVPSRWGGCMASAHSFGITKNFIVLVEQPFMICATKIAGAIIKKDAVKDWMSWHNNERTRFVIVHKNGHVCPTEYYSHEPFHFFHIINAYETEDLREIVIDITAHKTPDYLNSLYVSKIRRNVIESSDYPYPVRFRIPLSQVLKGESDTDVLKSLPENFNLLKLSLNKKDTCEARKKDNTIVLKPMVLTPSLTGLEMSSISPLKEGKPYNFLYSSSCIVCPSNSRGRIIKYDLESQEMRVWRQDDYSFPVGEPIFIPNPEGTEEDDGIVISPVIRTKSGGQDFLLFLDKNLQEIARATFKNDIPVAFHTTFVSRTRSSVA